VPFEDDGTAAVKSIHIRVCTYLNGCLKFDTQGNEDPNCTQDFVEIKSGANTTTARLHPGNYIFYALGGEPSFKDTDETLIIAQENGVNIGTDASNNTVNFHLQTVVGKVHRLSLT